MSPMELAMQEIRARQQVGERGQFLGGSTGARLFDVPQGRFVSKRGNSPAHVRNEYEMNRLLNLLGVGVPQAHLDDNQMITEFQQGRHIQPVRDRAHTARDIVPPRKESTEMVSTRFDARQLGFRCVRSLPMLSVRSILKCR